MWTAACLGAAAVAGWGAALVLALSMRRRRDRVADAEHELRGAATAIGLAADRVARTGTGAAFSALIRLQLDRMAAGLEDLAAARAGRSAGARASRAASLGDSSLDAGRLAQVLGNLIANAAEHGTGPVDVRASRPEGGVRIEIRNRNRPRELVEAGAAQQGRGRGLAIAERAARELGGRLTVESRDGETRAELELPERAA